MKKACDDMDRPITTLFMLMSVDGKITTGSSDHLDFDQDLPHIHGCWEGLQQYYDIEQTTDLWSLNSGRVQAKLGVNHKDAPTKSPVSFVLIDNTHLSEQGVRYFCRRSRKFVLVTTTTLIDGESITQTDQLAQLGVLKLESAQVLEHSYLRLRYRVIS